MPTIFVEKSVRYMTTDCPQNSLSVKYFYAFQKNEEINYKAAFFVKYLTGLQVVTNCGTITSLPPPLSQPGPGTGLFICKLEAVTARPAQTRSQQVRSSRFLQHNYYYHEKVIYLDIQRKRKLLKLYISNTFKLFCWLLGSKKSKRICRLPMVIYSVVNLCAGRCVCCV